MTNVFPPETSDYGEQWADVYDDWHPVDQSVLGAVDFLLDLAGDGPVLELAIGSGRLALPIAESGVEVHGIDNSPAMVQRLRERPGGEQIKVSIGNFADVDVDGDFSLVYLVFNTLFLLPSQEEQIQCFERVAQHLRPGGVFVLEAFVPRLDGSNDSSIAVRRYPTGETGLWMSVSDQATQTTHCTLFVPSPETNLVKSHHFRYSHPSELDLMARLAGLRLRQRTAGWNHTPFTSSSTAHVSVYEHQPPPSVNT